MRYLWILVYVFLHMGVSMHAQTRQTNTGPKVKGTVAEMRQNKPMAGIAISTSRGSHSVTNALGEFTITASPGDILTFESPEIETLRHQVTGTQEVHVRVIENKGEGSLAENKSAGERINLHNRHLDSARVYLKRDIGKSLEFVAQSINELGSKGNKSALAESLSFLGEVYQFHKQYDLAITSFQDALRANSTDRTVLLLGKTYILNGNYPEAEEILEPLLVTDSSIPFRQIEVYESLGDANKGLGRMDKAVKYYEEGLAIAIKHEITPKLPDLNSKIADVYAGDNRPGEATSFYRNSLEQASEEAPARSVQEKEKVADFFNSTNRYDDEIALRKKSLQTLKTLPESASVVSGAVPEKDSITSQQINYKIANAYIAQDKYQEAIPYLKQSINEAGTRNDLIVGKDATRKLSEVYEQQGDFTKAFETYQRYVALVDTLYLRKEQEISRSARLNREIAAKQSRISGLEQQRELSQSRYDLALTEQRLVQETNKRQQWLIYSLLAGILLTGIGAFFFYRSNQQQKLANNLLALKSLRSQMNPHFIFNALNSVNNYIARNDERSANRYLSEFSTLMRAVLENSEEDFIPLSKELELVQLYTRLEHSRFPEKFDYEVNIDERIDTEFFQIPPMLLQPYIENAIWHGLRYRETKGFLRVLMRQVNSELIEIRITDDGIGRKKSAELKTVHQKKQTSKAMGNISRRLQILNEMYKDRVEVSVKDLLPDHSGTEVILKLRRN